MLKEPNLLEEKCRGQSRKARNQGQEGIPKQLMQRSHLGAQIAHWVPGLAQRLLQSLAIQHSASALGRPLYQQATSAGPDSNDARAMLLLLLHRGLHIKAWSLSRGAVSLEQSHIWAQFQVTI